jgi:hypothetical protein
MEIVTITIILANLSTAIPCLKSVSCKVISKNVKAAPNIEVKSTQNMRPDGRGLKTYKADSLFEGYFSDGMCHGVGRGITSKGDLYQGGFRQDSMDGQGFYVYHDGRIYEGEWQNNKKHGKGTYFWPNG